MEKGKRTWWISLGAAVIVLIVLCSGIAMALNADNVAQIGPYVIKKQEMESLLILSAFSGDAPMDARQAAEQSARMYIAGQEIAGTEYDTVGTLKKFQKMSVEEYAENSTADDAFCESYGLSVKQLQEAVALSKYRIVLQGAHFQKIIDDYCAQHSEEEPAEMAADGFGQIYETYMQEKLQKMTFTVLDEKAVSGLEQQAQRLYAQIQKDPPEV